ncbi:class I SAM-dependent methyltransferase [Neptuniibacter caesariensis]|uniref:Methyltransferase, UbiE/COQ5 family protein n=1 Tax=Neptuniibacter caesariensis TaxID=207954 RepID=A0A7U8C6P7_NEPCE|nr:class I SAM-dependent methyltransferase [Neptuniibacter caesariensis]EAR62580.1 methyltransferase, UbiE/COQ5 family protein [Oceanospirillum sp. MED92] [Neptuniibacter caesariensis]
MSQSDKFWDSKAEGYAKSPVSDQATYERKLKETQQYLSPEMQILEFGCGTGSTAVQHAPHVKHIDAIDISEQMLSIARSRAEQSCVKNITFSLGTLEDFSAASESQDAVLGLNVIHLIPDRQSVLKEVARILKPGGIFVSSTGCLGNSYLRFIKLLVPLGKRLGLMPDIFIISEAELAVEIKAAGFEIEHQWHHGMDDVDVFIIARKIS